MPNSCGASNSDRSTRRTCRSRSDWRRALREHPHLRSNRVLHLSDGSPMSAAVVKAPRRTRGAASADCAEPWASVAPHVRFKSRDARWRKRARFQTRRPLNLATTQRYIHLSRVPLANVIRLPQPLWNAAEFWRHVGDGDRRIRILPTTTRTYKIPSTGTIPPVTCRRNSLELRHLPDLVGGVDGTRTRFDVNA